MPTLFHLLKGDANWIRQIPAVVDSFENASPKTVSYYPSPGFPCYHTMVAARLQSQRQNLRLTVLAGAIREMRSLAEPVSTAREDSICTWKQSPFLWVWIPPSINSESGNIRRDTYQTHNVTGGATERQVEKTGSSLLRFWHPRARVERLTQVIMQNVQGQ